MLLTVIMCCWVACVRCQSLLLGIRSASKPLAWLIEKARELHDATEDASLQEDADGKLGEALHLTEAQYEVCEEL